MLRYRMPLLTAKNSLKTWDFDYAIYLWDYMNLVDFAHVLYLAKHQLAPRVDLQNLMGGLIELERKGPNQIAFDPQLGDVYKVREAFLKKRCAPGVSGWLGFGRARREVSTVAFHMCLKNEISRFLDAHLDLAETIGNLAGKNLKSIMPEYTYYQPAQPTTLGHYLLSFVCAMSRDWPRILACRQRHDEYPGGIGSTNGSAIILDRSNLARRLGFEKLVTHARDAIWRADLVYETSTVGASFALTLSRLVDDFHIWCTKEFGFALIGKKSSRASVIMPQKTNPYTLSKIRGVLGQTLSQPYAVTLASRTGSNQLDNRISAYTEIPRTLERLSSTCQLAEEFFSEVKFNLPRMSERASLSGIQAMDLAEEISQKTKLSYSLSHQIVSESFPTDENHQVWIENIFEKVQKHLTDSNRKNFSKASLAKLMLPTILLNRRSCTGGASPQSSRDVWLELKKQIQDFRKQNSKLQLKTNKAWDKLKMDASAFAGKNGKKS